MSAATPEQLMVHELKQLGEKADKTNDTLERIEQLLHSIDAKLADLNSKSSYGS